MQKPLLNHIIKVIGVGGAGSNAVTHMYNVGVHEVDFVICNTDVQVLNESPVPNKFQLGVELTKGLGAGTEPEMGRKAAEESEVYIREILQAPTEMVFITAGMGGGTGTGAAPVIARIAKELGLLTVAVVTDPFGFEGTDKIAHAKTGIEELKRTCDTVLIIKNGLLADMFGDMPIDDAYAKADDVLWNAVKSIAELITQTGKMNVDFADVKKVLKDAGQAVMGSAEAEGVERATAAIEKALTSPLLDNCDINGAKRILVSMAFSDERSEYKMKMSEQTAIMKFVEEQIKRPARIFKHGYMIDNSLGAKMRVTVVAAGFDLPEEKQIENKLSGFKAGLPDPLDEIINKEKERNQTLQEMRAYNREKAHELVEFFLKNHYTTQAGNLGRPAYWRNEVQLDEVPRGKLNIYGFNNL